MSPRWRPEAWQNPVASAPEPKSPFLGRNETAPLGSLLQAEAALSCSTARDPILLPKVQNPALHQQRAAANHLILRQAPTGLPLLHYASQHCSALLAQTGCTLGHSVRANIEPNPPSFCPLRH